MASKETATAVNICDKPQLFISHQFSHPPCIYRWLATSVQCAAVQNGTDWLWVTGFQLRASETATASRNYWNKIRGSGLHSYEFFIFIFSIFVL